MTVFLSHQHGDKSIVTQYADALGQRIGKEKILLDSWTVRPGESIIDFMNNAIGGASHFILFWSKNASRSAAVKEEWQAALMKAHRGFLQIVVVRLDNEPVPPILAHRRYLEHISGSDSCLNELLSFYGGTLESSKIINASDLYYEVTFCKDDSLLFHIYSISELPEIGPFLISTDTHHSYFNFQAVIDRDFDVLVTDDAWFDGRSAYGIGFKFKSGGITKNDPAIIRLVKLRQCGPIISRLHIQRKNGLQALPLNRATDLTDKA